MSDSEDVQEQTQAAESKVAQKLHERLHSAQVFRDTGIDREFELKDSTAELERQRKSGPVKPGKDKYVSSLGSSYRQAPEPSSLSLRKRPAEAKALSELSAEMIRARSARHPLNTNCALRWVGGSHSRTNHIIGRSRSSSPWNQLRHEDEMERMLATCTDNFRAILPFYSMKEALQKPGPHYGQANSQAGAHWTSSQLVKGTPNAAFTQAPRFLSQFCTTNQYDGTGRVSKMREDRMTTPGPSIQFSSMRIAEGGKWHPRQAGAKWEKRPKGYINAKCLPSKMLPYRNLDRPATADTSFPESAMGTPAPGSRPASRSTLGSRPASRSGLISTPQGGSRPHSRQRALCEASGRRMDHLGPDPCSRCSTPGDIDIRSSWVSMFDNSMPRWNIQTTLDEAELKSQAAQTRPYSSPLKPSIR
jgi:hypothetical protein